MALATLSIDLEARLANLQAGLDKASRLAEKSANDIEAKFNKTAAAAKGIGAAFAGVFSVGALVQYFRATADGLDRLNDLKDATGATIENISALEDVALRTGTSFESMASSLVKFNKRLTEANAGSETANIFKRLGLDAEELRRVDPAEALRRTALALAGFADDGNKARLTQVLFGKSVQEVAKFLNDLAASGQLNATVTAEQARAANEFNNQLSAFTKNSADSARAIVSNLLPAMNALLESFQSAQINEFGDALGQLSEKSSAFAVPLQALSVLGANVAFVFKGVGTEIGAVAAQAAALGRGDFAGVSEIRRALIADAEFARQQLNEFEARVLGTKAATAIGLPSFRPSQNYGDTRRSVGNIPDADKASRAGRTAKATDFAGTVLDSTTLAALKRLEDSDEQKLNALRLELQALLELDAGAGSAATGEALRKLGEEMQKLDPQARAAAESARRLNELLDATPTGQLSAVLKDVELINDAFERGAIQSVELWAEAIRGSVAKLPAETAKALDEMSEFTKQFQRNVQDALGSTVRDTLRGNFEDIGDLWKNLLIDMSSQAIAADLGKRLFGDGNGGGGGYFAALAGLFGFANGGAFGAGGSVMAFADGGVLTRATPFGMSGGRMGVAGEAGPEAVLPLKRGADGKLGVAGGGGLTVINNIAAGVTRGEMNSAVQLGMQSAEASVYRRLKAQRVI